MRRRKLKKTLHSRKGVESIAIEKAGWPNTTRRKPYYGIHEKLTLTGADTSLNRRIGEQRAAIAVR